ncbi:unnamed protein product [Allacma fusca]|uniref:Glucoside xylosyltransferase 2 n=1 Tax=Allacma fusca TaxID=39272 RepID=A0A8J2JST4_9HEXA|nr:unnamed protein product [Allacma fusca]
MTLKIVSRRSKRKVNTIVISALAVTTLVFLGIKFFCYYFSPNSNITLVTIKFLEVSTKPSLLGNEINKFHSATVHESLSPSERYPENNSSNCPVTVVLILCNDGNKQTSVVTSSLTVSQNPKKFPNPGSVKDHPRGKPILRNFDRQINQTVVLLKSIVLQQQFANLAKDKNDYSSKKHQSGQACVNVLILSDEKENYERVKQTINGQQWSPEFTRWINLTFVPVSYPPGTQWMRKLFRPCATLRLFLADLLPQHDSVIYLDTDIIFLRNIQDLWDEFNKFRSSMALAAMAPCLNHYQSSANHVPFYGKTGLNAGVMLMNLTRIRSSGWTGKILEVTSEFKSKITLADQDILNIYFHSNPEEVHELTCDWNFRPFQCRKGSFCQDLTLTQGISALHGNALSFTSEGSEPLFHTVFSTFQRLNLTFSDPIIVKQLVKDIQTRLGRLEGRSTSDCSHFGAFNLLLLDRMNSLVQN